MISPETICKISSSQCPRKIAQAEFPPLCLPAGHPIAAEALCVIDGDTVDFIIAASLDPKTSYSRVRVRVSGVDTPELHPKNVSDEEQTLQKECGIIAKKFTERLLAPAEAGKQPTRVTIVPMPVGADGLTTCDSFGRVLAEVVFSDGETLADKLIAAGFARRFIPGKTASSHDWTCAEFRAMIALAGE